MSSISSTVTNRELYKEFLALLTPQRRESFPCLDKESQKDMYYGWKARCAQPISTELEISWLATVRRTPVTAASGEQHSPVLQSASAVGSSWGHKIPVVSPSCPLDALLVLLFGNALKEDTSVVEFDSDHENFNVLENYISMAMLGKFLYCLTRLHWSLDLCCCLVAAEQYCPPAVRDIASCKLAWPLEGVVTRPPCSEAWLFSEYRQVIHFNHSVVWV